MIKITIELESANTGETTILGKMYIWNLGKKHAKASKNKPGRYNYGVAVCKKDTIQITLVEHHQRQLELDMFLTTLLMRIMYGV